MPSPKLTARINALRCTLKEIELDIETCQLLLNLESHSGLYCASCTPLLQPGNCGPTCPLLRPLDRTWTPGVTKKWVRNATADRALYRDTMDDMDARGYEVHAATVGRWERAVTKLRLRSRTCAEAHHDAHCRLIGPMRYQGAFDRTWEFANRWGTGIAFYDDIAPEDPRRNSKRKCIPGEALGSKRFKRM